MPRTAPKTLNRLDRKTMWRLAKLVEGSYKSSGMTDREFAAANEEAFGLPLTEHSIKAARDLLDLESNVKAKTGGAASRTAHTRIDAHDAKIDYLEKCLSGLSQRLEVYISGSRKLA